MLLNLLEKAVQLGADYIEVEYKDGKEWIFAYRGNMGSGIASLDSEEAKPLFRELDALRKQKQAVLGGATYRLGFSRYESFGEWVQRIEIKPARSKAVPKQR